MALNIRDIDINKSYTCHFRTTTMLDTFGRVPGLSDTPLKGVGEYVSFGNLVARDLENELIEVFDPVANQPFVVPFADILDLELQ